MTRLWLICMIFTVVFFAGKVHAKGSVFSEDADRVDLSQAKSFEEYLKSGTEEQRAAAAIRMETCEPSQFFIDGAKKIDSPVILLTIGMMFCPDCKVIYPYTEALARSNPLIRTKYIVRNETPGAREFMTARTGRTNMPAIFVLKQDGTVLDGAYVETPAKVTALLEAAIAGKDEKKSDAIFDDFHNGIYDEDVQRDLLALINR